VLDQGSGITVQNSLLALNGGGNCAGAILDGGHNLSFGAAGCPAGFASGDPNLGALQNNGGPAPTISLQAGSAAIDQIPASGANCPSTDERGVRRPSASKCDIGAYEVARPVVKTGNATKVNNTFATLTGLVTANAGAAIVVFQYGSTPRLGSRTPAQQVGGVTPVPVAMRVLQLKSKRTYFYRVVATTIDGTSYGAVAKFTTVPAPVISALSISPRRFAAGGHAMISYKDSMAARTKFVVLRCVTRRRGKCVRTARAGTFTHADRKGRNSISFSGKLGRRMLSRGSYLLEASPHAARVGKTVTVRFGIT
jgi:hypothetical protein